MRSVDTNVLARFILADDMPQHRIASAVLAEPVWVTPTVWLELGWLLHKRLKLARSVVADAMIVLLSIETIRTQGSDRLRWAIEQYRSGADWADAMHLIMSEDVADKFATFDKGVARQVGEAASVSIEILA
ncbi:MAG: type II toxin-antitoxin system VapC family toxin [Sphingomonas sp.]|uniref:type II toxin-antitoxin system VapC family toxin n=1 Tax=unclassified Sphingomonas TaxID=196159 RepID=UPI002454CB95|nr:MULTISPECIES: type II toxin-antitoxin system VapC family toxin [unclassified Sphingomonas]MBQ1498093.1 type II toxin-antitoxin system VapC family toxin [Sphingomonas sp.]MDH4742668.1 type II toxin-antitoxin system VapC family toxin [Sphingomonas sp. CBMAI 2297]